MGVLMRECEQRDHDNESVTVFGTVKWFDHQRGYGFISVDGYEDILLHSNVVKNHGQTGVSQGTPITARVIPSPRGYKVVSIVEIAERAFKSDESVTHPFGLSEAFLASLEVLPARVKWYSIGKGFGFVTVYGSRNDVFLLGDILRASCLGFPVTGEAIGVKVIDGNKGPIVVKVLAWPSSSVGRQSITLAKQ